MLTSALSIVVRQTMACCQHLIFIVCLSTRRLTSFMIHIWSTWKQTLCGEWLKENYVLYPESIPAIRIIIKIGLADWVIYLVNWQWQRSRTQSIGPNDSNEKCAMSRVLFGQYCCNTENMWPWPFTFDLDLFPWHLTLIFDLETDLLLPWCFKENITKMYCFDVTWRKNGTSYVRTETNLSISILSVNILQPTRSLYSFRFQSYGSKCGFWFHGFWCVWPWHFEVI